LLAAGVLLFVLAALPLTAGAQALPSGWSSTDIGSPAVSGSATQSSGTYTVQGAGTDVWYTYDQFRFVYRSWTGDGTIVARVASVQRTDDWSKAGVMIRETLTAGSKHAFMVVSAAKGVSFQRRAATSGSSTANTVAGLAPMWVKLDRKGSLLTASYSANGSTWTVAGSETIAMASTVYVGLGITSHKSSATSTAVISDVSVQAPATSTLPSGWSTADVGSPAIAGSATYSGTSFNVSGAGNDVWDAADQFRYVYRQMSGDLDVVARVASVQNITAWTKAGVMIRESLGSGAANAFMLISAANGAAFQQRTSGGSLSQSTRASGAAPRWVKIARRGTTLTGSISSDGSSWTVVGSATMTLPSTFYIGLAVTSHDATRAATGVFDNVNALAATGNQPPTVSLTSPASGATYTAPASIPVSANASDSDGSVARVDFYQGSTLIGSDATTPFGVTWSNVGAGTYSVVAVARDNGGASTTSAARTVTVSGGGPPTTAVFNPSSNDSIVTNYVFEVFTAGSNTSTGTPLATQNLGKPPIVNGECTVDVRSTIAALPAGNYVATVRATASGGSARSAPSATFTR